MTLMEEVLPWGQALVSKPCTTPNMVSLHLTLWLRCELQTCCLAKGMTQQLPAPGVQSQGERRVSMSKGDEDHDGENHRDN